MFANKLVRKLTASIGITSMVLSTIISASPFIPIANASLLKSSVTSFNVLTYVNNLSKQNQIQPQSEENSANTDNKNQNELIQGLASNNQSGLTQEEIDKIVSAHFDNQDNTGNKQDANTSNISGQDDLNVPTKLDDQKTDRFIVKYKNEIQKDDTEKKLRGNIKQRLQTKNKKFDILISKDKMKKTEFQSLVKQQNVDTNIEYIQPDYQVTVPTTRLPEMSWEQILYLEQ